MEGGTDGLPEERNKESILERNKESIKVVINGLI